ncbi:MAG: hypothetical protein H8E44_06455 [Planctomycetes bacterium]|nr:hypothetical protein [Planctomycetota bacterium]MBL7039348.1 hypothetical protein [Pirellulaceae bacterium]
MRSAIAASVLLAMQATSTAAQAPDEPATTLDDGVSVRVLGARTWTPPQQKFLIQESVPKGKYAIWFVRSIGETRAEFAQTAVNPVMPKGTYVEILAVFENAANKPVTVDLSSKSGSLDVRLTLADKSTVTPVDFLLPHTNWGDPAKLKRLHVKGLTIVNEFTGGLKVHLSPEQTTWLILLFDVPANTKPGDLCVRDGEALRIHS